MWFRKKKKSNKSSAKANRPKPKVVHLGDREKQEDEPELEAPQEELEEQSQPVAYVEEADWEEDIQEPEAEVEEVSEEETPTPTEPESIESPEPVLEETPAEVAEETDLSVPEEEIVEAVEQPETDIQSEEKTKEPVVEVVDEPIEAMAPSVETLDPPVVEEEEKPPAAPVTPDPESPIVEAPTPEPEIPIAVAPTPEPEKPLNTPLVETSSPEISAAKPEPEPTPAPKPAIPADTEVLDSLRKRLKLIEQKKAKQPYEIKTAAEEVSPEPILEQVAKTPETTSQVTPTPDSIEKVTEEVASEPSIESEKAEETPAEENLVEPIEMPVVEQEEEVEEQVEEPILESNEAVDESEEEDEPEPEVEQDAFASAPESPQITPVGQDQIPFFIYEEPLEPDLPIPIEELEPTETAASETSPTREKPTPEPRVERPRRKRMEPKRRPAPKEEEEQDEPEEEAMAASHEENLDNEGESHHVLIAPKITKKVTPEPEVEEAEPEEGQRRWSWAEEEEEEEEVVEESPEPESDTYEEIEDEVEEEDEPVEVPDRPQPKVVFVRKKEESEASEEEYPADPNPRARIRKKTSKPETEESSPSDEAEADDWDEWEDEFDEVPATSSRSLRPKVVVLASEEEEEPETYHTVAKTETEEYEDEEYEDEYEEVIDTPEPHYDEEGGEIVVRKRSGTPGYQEDFALWKKRRRKNILLAVFGVVVVGLAVSTFVFREAIFGVSFSAEEENCLGIQPNIDLGYPLHKMKCMEGIANEDQGLEDLLLAQNVHYEAILDLLQRVKAAGTPPLTAGDRYISLYEKGSVKAPRIFAYEPDASQMVIIRIDENPFVYAQKREVVNTSLHKEDVIIRSDLAESMYNREFGLDMTEKMEDALQWQVDFFHLGPGDHFTLLFDENEMEGGIKQIDLLRAVRYQVGGEWMEAYYFDNQGFPGYFDELGRPVETPFLKAPIRYGRVSSSFSWRRPDPLSEDGTPIPHLGTDYAAPLGTEILAVADGLVTEAAIGNANGIYVKIRHNDTTDTQYLHMQGFAKGIKKGVRVRQGQVIGYVGSTGRSTGPHVCFRYWKNGEQVDHRKEKYPVGSPLKGTAMDRFLTEMDRCRTAMN